MKVMQDEGFPIAQIGASGGSLSILQQKPGLIPSKPRLWNSHVQGLYNIFINLIFNPRIQEYGKNEENTGEKGEERKTSKNEDQVSRDPFNQQLSISPELFLGSQVI